MIQVNFKSSSPSAASSSTTSTNQNHSILYSDILENDSNELFQPNFFLDVQIDKIFGNINSKKKWQTETFNISNNSQLSSKSHSSNNLLNLSSPYIEPILTQKGTFQFV